ncbi:MAG: Eco57I restriction-modification methylase domain-containing protein [Thermocrinis sp.]|uniref:Eco57I restriction-modification methylase domain-containing protein n=1 Tax=Thermocrinis sp. TaxID=2024383 RepID=UPI003C0067F4
MNSERLLLLVQDLRELERNIESRGLYRPNLKTAEVEEYYEALKSGSLPEHATYVVFFVLFKELFGEVPPPQVRTRSRVSDYAIINESYKYKIAIEVKSPFSRESGKLRRNTLQPKNYSDQVRAYLEREGYDYVILTDVYTWYFFSRSSLLEDPRRPIPFKALSLEDLLDFLQEKRQRKQMDIIQTCRELERNYPLRDLDRYFFRDLKEYVREFEQLLGDQKYAVKIINSLVFLRTLEETNVVDYKRLEERLSIWERDYGKETKKVFEKLLDDVKSFYYDYFDTDLFKWEEILRSIPEDKQTDFVRTLKKVMGYDRYSSAFYKGLKFYNFELIDEDVFGKSYEMFLAEQRKEEGIYYTPKNITQYLVDTCLNSVFKPLKEELRASILENNIQKACEIAQRIKEIKILDPACGSGSFLVKVVRYLFRFYEELVEKLKDVRDGFFVVANERLRKVREILEINSTFDIELAKKIVSRHVFGIDLDKSAISVARTNIWKEMLKLKPEIYKLDRIRSIRDHQLFPSLEENIIHADTLLSDIDTTFTVIVGNPPYVRDERLDKNYKNALLERYPIAVSTWDLYAYFILRAYELLEEGGVLGFIVSNKWLRAEYGEPLREFLARNVQIKEIRDYTGCNVFPSARVDPMTIIFQKSKPTEPYEFSFVRGKDEIEIRVSSTVLSASPWILEREEVYQIKRKLEAVGKPLKEWDVKIYRGVLTGYNDAFIIDTQTRNRILANCKDEEERKRTEEIIKPVLRGRDIERYRYKWAGLWIILATKHTTTSCILNYLERHKEALERRAGDQEWYELQAPPSREKINLLLMDKIGYSDIGLRFAFIPSGIVGLNTTYFIIPYGKDRERILLYLLGLLNSKLIMFYYLNTAQVLSESTTRGFSIYIEQLPIPPITPQNQHLADQIVQKVQEILSLTQSSDFETCQEKQQKVKELEREIDQLVYKLYGLTEEEIRVVEEG